MSWPKYNWEALVGKIRKGRCTPFLGSGACVPPLPTGGKLAEICAQHFQYPFDEHRDDLSKVTQYAVMQADSWAVRDFVGDYLKGCGRPDFENPNEPHRLLADLGLPIYITTNYDSFMLDALEWCGRDAKRVVCPWHQARQGQRNIPVSEWSAVSTANPAVFHLHGFWDDLDSMVLTEDDYLDFLIWVNELIPPRIEEAFTHSSLLFMGYSLRDVNFKVLFRKLTYYMRRNPGRDHVAVQIDPETLADSDVKRELAKTTRAYLEQQFASMSIRVYWGKCDEFAAELRDYWDRYGNGEPPTPPADSVRGAAAVHGL